MLFFVFIDGKFLDIQFYREKIKEIWNLSFGVVVGCVVGYMVNDEILKELIDNVVYFVFVDSLIFK